jgi:hypothetical protein
MRNYNMLKYENSFLSSSKITNLNFQRKSGLKSSKFIPGIDFEDQEVVRRRRIIMDNVQKLEESDYSCLQDP